MLEDAQQMLPMKVALHARRIVVDAERQIGGVGDVEEEALDVGFRRADIGGRRQDGAVGAVVLGEADIGDRRLGVVAGAAEEDRHARRLHLGGLDDDLLLFFGRQHRGLAGRAHDQHRRRAALFLEFEQRAKRGEIDRAVLVERRDQRDERACQQFLRHCCLHSASRTTIARVQLEWIHASGRPRRSSISDAHARLPAAANTGGVKARTGTAAAPALDLDQGGERAGALGERRRADVEGEHVGIAMPLGLARCA